MKRNFTLLKNGETSSHVFTGRYPRQAALKAATRGQKKIALLEHGTKKVHMFCGSTKTIPTTKLEREKAAWLGATKTVPSVKKVGTQRLQVSKDEARAGKSGMQGFTC